MLILEAWRNYQTVVLFAALYDDFDFEADYKAYCAMAACDVEKLIVMATQRRRRLVRVVNGAIHRGVKPSQVKFHKKGPKSFEAAKAKHDDVKAEWCKETFGTKKKRNAYLRKTKAPIHLVKITGEQAKRPGGPSDLTAHYSHKRPRKVRSAFGDVDNRPVFDSE